ncbi:MAG: hypothetical protein UU11_C0001G0054 [Parcubacteria group bacterium GW2011_GWF2_40_69]|nr:MAG: hypothetical protein UT25_C0002G0046 [Parcubacteria group bacterium GW2011_GWC1_39_12]KKR19455.1 MAG: hypothetical protein UT49_C0002G0301 [Parcubacteria group bacterium GW2011_GWF1_39_37]KKR35081.1 MAG: hypothetical protein UT68_C0005G0030 [Parcubacteria group bacterium GW2011_GWC2_40_10]KKR52404.1 MAG: hypothetical protein UT89_C0002G0205 [Parcubacteria group bacterium GW2011_GWE1_40_20]KKR69468.1 MAG: hypothetical protein UU11_C0001G0054 [Parcubacteria group bacterium GW2011_GWF2_40_
MSQHPLIHQHQKHLRPHQQHKNMNEDILKDQPEYVKNLPKPIQDFIFNSAWSERVEEIAKKYTLNETQTEDLVDNVLLLLIGLLEPKELLGTIIAELNISQLLAEQLVDDLEVRVFDYALKSMQNKEKGLILPAENTKSEMPPVPTTPKSVLDIQNDLPEIRPEITPLVELGETAHTNPVLTTQKEATPQRVYKYGPQDPVKTEQVAPIHIPESPKLSPEQIQKPFSVPRYIGEDGEVKPETEMLQKPARISYGGTSTTSELPEAESFMDLNTGGEMKKTAYIPSYNKTQPEEPAKPQEIKATETKPVAEVKPEEPPKIPEPITPPVKRYDVDPYREPLE